MAENEISEAHVYFCLNFDAFAGPLVLHRISVLRVFFGWVSIPRRAIPRILIPRG